MIYNLFWFRHAGDTRAFNSELVNEMSPDLGQRVVRRFSQPSEVSGLYILIFFVIFSHLDNFCEGITSFRMGWKWQWDWLWSKVSNQFHFWKRKTRPNCLVAYSMTFTHSFLRKKLTRIPFQNSVASSVLPFNSYVILDIKLTPNFCLLLGLYSSILMRNWEAGIVGLFTNSGLLNFNLT